MHNGRARDRSRSRGSGAGGDMERGARPVRTGRRALSAMLGGSGAEWKRGQRLRVAAGAAARACPSDHVVEQRCSSGDARRATEKKKEDRTRGGARGWKGGEGKERAEAKGQGAQGIAAEREIYSEKQPRRGWTSAHRARSGAEKQNKKGTETGLPLISSLMV